MTTDKPDTFLPRRVDHLGIIRQKLADLSGFGTMVYELLQNAEDAKACRIVFRIDDDALVVENDSIFSACDNLEAAVCPLATAGVRKRCDFHGLRTLAGEEKRGYADTIGAFGVGFLAVLQITDTPHLISAGRHWIIDETQPENSRIRNCSGCQHCKASELPGTQFRLPWARDKDSAMRCGLRLTTITETVVDELEREMTDALRLAMLFLRKLETAEVWRGSIQREKIERLIDTGTVVLQDLHGTQLWHVMEGNFAPEAEALRGKHPGMIAAKKTASVHIAIRSQELVEGIFCAFLPTQQQTLLPFHIQADFITSPDRKRVSFEPGVNEDWNTAAIAASARALAGALEVSKTHLGPVLLWRLLQSLVTAASKAKSGELPPVFGDFWKLVQPVVKTTPCVWLASKTWVVPAEALLLESEGEGESEPLLTGLGVPIVHASLRPYFSVLRSTEIGVRLLDIPDVTRALRDHGVTSPFDPSGTPGPMSEPRFPERICAALGILLNRKRTPEDRRHVDSEVQSAAIVPCRDGLWRANCEVFWTDDETAKLFETLALNLAFASQDSASPTLEGNRRCFDVSAAVAAIAASPALLELYPGTVGPLFSWLDGRKSELRNDEKLRTKLAEQRIFPSANGLGPLTSLSLSGDFNDPLDLAELVDVEALGGHRELLEELGATELTIQKYAKQHVPRALEDGEQPIEKRRAVVHLLAAKLGELRDDTEARLCLRASPIVECEDGRFRKPEGLYLPGHIVQAVLGTEVICSSAPSGRPGALREFLLWLGVAKEPRPDDVFVGIAKLARGLPSAESVECASTILQYLAEQYGDGKVVATDVERLKALAWLPAESDDKRWYMSSQIQSTSRASLFQSQGHFLGFSRPVQEDAGKLLEALGVRTDPTPRQVVSHLIYCAENGKSLDREVFSFLDDAAGNDEGRAALQLLEKKACILLPDGKYYKPQQVFWDEQPFGRWRAVLSSDCKYQRLFKQLGVRKAPAGCDALAVLSEIERDFGPPRNRRLGDDELTVVGQCWQLLAAALDKGETGIVGELGGLSRRKVVSGPQHLLVEPASLFVEDRTGFKERFPRLKHNLIPKPDRAWPALEAAGVKSIAKDAEVVVLEALGEQPDELLKERLKERLRELDRVAAKPGKSGPTLDVLIAQLNYVAVDKLEIHFKVDFFGKVEFSESETADACYDRGARIIYNRCRATEPSRCWLAIAKELAEALGVASEEVGPLASSFERVLAADTLEDARHMLDALGFSRLDESAMAASSVNTLECLAGADDLPDLEPYPASGEMRPDYDSAPPGSTSAAAIPSGAGAIYPVGGASAERGNIRTRDQSDRQRSDSAAQTKLRSYVSRNDSKPDARTAAIDQSGIAYVMRFETDAGRSPTEMPHDNPGYDIESRDASGRVVRYIEVKSSAVTWGAQGVALSGVQFKRASTSGDAYWLYVVDRALDETAKLYRIQNPAQRVNQYVFDDGWCVVAE